MIINFDAFTRVQLVEHIERLNQENVLLADDLRTSKRIIDFRDTEIARLKQDITALNLCIEDIGTDNFDLRQEVTAYKHNNDGLQDTINQINGRENVTRSQLNQANKLLNIKNQLIEKQKKAIELLQQRTTNTTAETNHTFLLTAKELYYEKKQLERKLYDYKSKCHPASRYDTAAPPRLRIGHGLARRAHRFAARIDTPRPAPPQ